jgi:DGQHR domain-containing protein
VADRYQLRLPALRLTQGQHHIYVFGVDGKRLDDFTTVSRARRDDDGLQGYQRPEVVAHIRAIRRYLESNGAMLPNAIVLAFTDQVTFEASKAGDADEAVTYSHPGVLVIPVDESCADADKPAWLVDGQQRTAAIRDADLAEFPVAAVGFIATGEDEQRSQFILVNSTKPLPKGLIHELLPETAGELPAQYARRRLPASLMTKLNTATGSPFRGAISTPTTPGGYIKDNSVLKMIENSLYDGALYQYRDSQTGEGDEDLMVRHLITFWSRVQERWPAAWELPPRKSRLTHGVGIQSLGYIMDLLTADIGTSDPSLVNLIDDSLQLLAPTTAWTDGVWHLSPGDERRWNGLQNTPNDVRKLTNLFVQIIRQQEGTGQLAIDIKPERPNSTAAVEPA